jgi:hypothetical protein
VGQRVFLEPASIAWCLANRTKVQVGKKFADGYLTQLLDDDLALVEEMGHSTLLGIW